MKLKHFLILGLFMLCAISVNTYYSKNFSQSSSHEYLNSAQEEIPCFNFSTYVGGSMMEEGYSIAVDAAGDCCIVGGTESSDFPTWNAYDNTLNGLIDIFITKFNSVGDVIFSTYFGGDEFEAARSVVMDDSGACYITGLAATSDFPIRNAYDSTFNGGFGDIFIAKFNSDGTLNFSTFFGGSDYDFEGAIEVDDDGCVYIVGNTHSTDIPLLNSYDNSLNGELDWFLAKFNQNGTLNFSTYFGGNYDDYARALVVDNDGYCYITGETSSQNYPMLNAYDTSTDGSEAYITKFNPDGTLNFSTYLGGSDMDYADEIDVDPVGNFIVAGRTSSHNFPLKNAIDSTLGGDQDAFVTKFNADLTLNFSSFLGGSDFDESYGIAVDTEGNSYISGVTASNDFLLYNACDSQIEQQQQVDAFITVLDKDGTLTFSTLLGGISSDYTWDIAVTDIGVCYLTGLTGGENFPTFNAHQNRYGGVTDAFVTKMYVPCTNCVSIMKLIPGFSIPILLLISTIGISMVMVARFIHIYQNKK